VRNYYNETYYDETTKEWETTPAGELYGLADEEFRW
jgi:hypothetical protein